MTITTKAASPHPAPVAGTPVRGAPCFAQSGAAWPHGGLAHCQ